MVEPFVVLGFKPGASHTQSSDASWVDLIGTDGIVVSLRLHRLSGLCSSADLCVVPDAITRFKWCHWSDRIIVSARKFYTEVMSHGHLLLNMAHKLSHVEKVSCMYFSKSSLRSTLIYI